MNEHTDEGERDATVIHLHSLLTDVSSKWFEIGALLGIPINILTIIKDNEDLDAGMRLRGVIKVREY